MYNRDYSKEVGLDTGEKIIPWRYLIPVTALVCALCWLGIVMLHRSSENRRAHSERIESGQHS